MMNPFSYVSVTNEGQALAAKRDDAMFLAGGTNLLDEMKIGLHHPATLIDVSKLPLANIEPIAGGGLRIGATVRNSALAYDDRVMKSYPALSQAILSGASAQLRNAATTAGNLLQRTRCYYYRDPASACNKRSPGSGCSAIDGFNRIHAILGTSEKCIATHPSDMDVALTAFDAVINVQGPNGNRAIPIADFYIPYGDDPARETTLAPGELILSVDLPDVPWFSKSTYYKARDRASYEFALSSAAIALDVADGTIRDSRIALGGVATKPWRAHAAEGVLKGQKPTPELFASAVDAELKAAVPQKHNAFKIELTRRVVTHTLSTLTA